MRTMIVVSALLLVVFSQELRAEEDYGNGIQLLPQSSSRFAPVTLASRGAEGSADPGTIGKKSPVGAFCLSLLLPGLGQHYNDQHRKGVLQETAFVVGAAISIVGFANTNVFDSDGADEAVVGIGLGIAVGAYLWSLIDAPISASRINKSQEQEKRSSLELKPRTGEAGLDLGQIPGGVCAGISFRF